MVAEEPTEKLRTDYAPFPYRIDEISLDFELGTETTTVIATLRIQPAAAGDECLPLVLDGCPEIDLQSLHIDGRKLEPSEYDLQPASLTVLTPPTGPFVLGSTVRIKPQENTKLEGLYRTSGNFCSHCEAEGFRNITFFPDRPDVLTKYTVKITASQHECPVLLSNGNEVSKGELEGGRHFVVFVDPFPKPSYLFALVAGTLAVREGTFTSLSGKVVDLRIWVQPPNIDRTAHALESLKLAMKWEEDRFGNTTYYTAHNLMLACSLTFLNHSESACPVAGLEYDLSVFNIVAVDDFNMGAMENKGLNIFNSACVLASPETATDSTYERIQGIVGHEYFHNWTGNRVTCRDWFQLTLKEGLTVFRDSEFTSDLNSRAVKRIGDVKSLRARQFSEDAGPMAHPIRPASYVKMDNFYTPTVYEKGCEVVKMYMTMLGQEGFRKGMDLYFQRHDGQAVTCEDFYNSMVDANEVQLPGLLKWYFQAGKLLLLWQCFERQHFGSGTPTVSIETSYDSAAHTFSITCTQSLKQTPGCEHPEPMLVPIAVGLLGPDGSDLALHQLTVDDQAALSLENLDGTFPTTAVLKLTKEKQLFVFEHVETAPVPSLLRGFSAPVRLESTSALTDQNLTFLLAHDSDAFNRWESAQILYKRLIMCCYEGPHTMKTSDFFIQKIATLASALRKLLQDRSLDQAFVAFCLEPPTREELLSSMDNVDPVRLHQSHAFVQHSVASALKDELIAIYQETSSTAAYVWETVAAAKRSLQNAALRLLGTLSAEEPTVLELLEGAFKTTSNMTDTMGALAALNSHPSTVRDAALQSFYERWKHDNTVILQFFRLAAGAAFAGNISAVKDLLRCEAFNWKNPTKCGAVFLPFADAIVDFHAADGSGYEFYSDCLLELDQVNGTKAARLASRFTGWKKYDAGRQTLMKEQLERIRGTDGVSPNLLEIVLKSLA